MSMTEDNIPLAIIINNENIPEEIFSSSVDKYFGPQVEDFNKSCLVVCILSAATGLEPSESNVATYIKSQWLFLTNFPSNKIFEFRIVICDNKTWKIKAQEDDGLSRKVQTAPVECDKTFLIRIKWNEPLQISMESTMELYSMDESFIKSQYEITDNLGGDNSHVDFFETIQSLDTIKEDLDDNESLIDSLHEKSIDTSDSENSLQENNIEKEDDQNTNDKTIESSEGNSNEIKYEKLQLSKERREERLTKIQSILGVRSELDRIKIYDFESLKKPKVLILHDQSYENESTENLENDDFNCELSIINDYQPYETVTPLEIIHPKSCNPEIKSQMMLKGFSNETVITLSDDVECNIDNQTHFPQTYDHVKTIESESSSQYRKEEHNVNNVNLSHDSNDVYLNNPVPEIKEEIAMSTSQDCIPLTTTTEGSINTILQNGTNLSDHQNYSYEDSNNPIQERTSSHHEEQIITQSELSPNLTSEIENVSSNLEILEFCSTNDKNSDHEYNGSFEKKVEYEIDIGKENSDQNETEKLCENKDNSISENIETVQPKIENVIEMFENLKSKEEPLVTSKVYITDKVDINSLRKKFEIESNENESDNTLKKMEKIEENSEINKGCHQENKENNTCETSINLIGDENRNEIEKIQNLRSRKYSDDVTNENNKIEKCDSSENEVNYITSNLKRSQPKLDTEEINNFSKNLSITDIKQIVSEKREKLAINDDYKYPDSVTPTKVEHDLLKSPEYNVPFMDDDSFYNGCWYEESHERWTSLDRPIYNKDISMLSPEDAVIMAHLDSIEIVKENEAVKPQVIIESIKKESKRNVLINLCSCVGGR